MIVSIRNTLLYKKTVPITASLDIKTDFSLRLNKRIKRIAAQARLSAQQHIKIVLPHRFNRRFKAFPAFWFGQGAPI